MKTVSALGLVILAVAAFLAYSSIFVIDEREKALVIRFGEIERTVETPGLNFKLPVFERLVRVEDRMLFVESTDKAVQVIDGRRYSVDAITMLRVVDPRKFRETVGASFVRARERIETRLDSALRQTYGRRTFDAALSSDRGAMMREIRDHIRREARSLGIEIVDVRIRRTELLPAVLNDTYERMNAERFAEAAELRAIGRAQAMRIRAEAEREAVELIAAARRESEILRGNGEAERIRIFAAAHQRDPEFYSFYRSMDAYRHSLKGADTFMVLSPSSEFFRHFGTQGDIQGQQLAPEQPPKRMPKGSDPMPQAANDLVPEVSIPQ